MYEVENRPCVDPKVRDDLSSCSLGELVVRTQAGEGGAFAELFLRCKATVYRVAYRAINDHAAAEDVVQEVFAIAMQKIASVQQPDAILGWLCCIARRQALNTVRRNRPFAKVSENLLALLAVDSSRPEDRLMRQEKCQAVHGVLHALGGMDAEILTVFHLERRSIDETAAELEIPDGTVKRRLHVARKRFAKIALGLDVLH